ncbi:hypothetical protein L1049_007199 [Liquidambar formosana]|uniref:Uncharacterized protein n=1 Tax=Liquidambar formosana TaxID=63359 RepID=A0AAP0RIC8_LIQFO
MEWKAFAAILNFICPLFGRGLLSWKLLPSAAAVTVLTLFFMVETEGDFLGNVKWLCSNIACRPSHLVV